MLTWHYLCIIIITIGSCVEHVGIIGGCCESNNCSSRGCYCDQACYQSNDCCSDIEDIGCFPLGGK